MWLEKLNPDHDLCTNTDHLPSPWQHQLYPLSTFCHKCFQVALLFTPMSHRPPDHFTFSTNCRTKESRQSITALYSTNQQCPFTQTILHWWEREPHIVPPADPEQYPFTLAHILIAKPSGPLNHVTSGVKSLTPK